MSEEGYKPTPEEIQKAEDHLWVDYPQNNMGYESRYREGDINQRIQSIDFENRVEGISDILPSPIDGGYDFGKLYEINVSDPLNLHLEYFGYKVTYKISAKSKDGDFNLFAIINFPNGEEQRQYFCVNKEKGEDSISTSPNDRVPVKLKSFRQARRLIMDKILMTQKNNTEALDKFLNDSSDSVMLPSSDERKNER